jgi:hypothetical protein
MKIQPGVGYTFDSSNKGFTFDVSEQFPERDKEPPEDTCTPFKVKNIKEVDSGGSSYVTYEICPGTFNNEMPQVYNETEEVFEYLDDLTAGYQLILDFASTSSSIVYLRVGKDASTNQFPPSSPISPYDPADPYPTVFNTGGALPADTDTYGYLALAKVNALGSGVYSVDQYVTGSLWGDRIKLGSATATYYYARI